MEEYPKKLALVLSGGGARGAYEAGIIHYIRTQIPKNQGGTRPFDILCGSSVGAINTCFLAATSHNLKYQGQKALELWHGLDQRHIYNRGMGSMTRFMSRSVMGVMRNLFGKQPKTMEDTINKKHPFRGVLDTSPFPKFLDDVIPWKQVSLNVRNGVTKAVIVTATNVRSGKVEFFIDKHPSIEYSGRHTAHFVSIEKEHAMASAAIPLMFPTVKIGTDHYCDGGLRLNTPLSPAIHMGAEKVMVIGLHHASERADEDYNLAHLDQLKSSPSMGEVLGQVLKSVFLDRLDSDLTQVNRINRIITAGEAAFGPDFVQRMKDPLRNAGQANDIGVRGLNKIEIMSIFPSVDVRSIFAETLEETQFLKNSLSTFEKMLLRVMDVDLQSGLDFLTFILFIPSYVRKLIDLGYEDARARHDDFVKFFSS